ncbi:DUF4148 domain-containing protein [Paraburkholderia phymatum]|uniref:DUF4148 domain-containing protein n=1 Tax=Paraburkholderia phymatum (strain DSM 17167 / CIP 108236 / LMG 21445 / STM815) TaxID=391038 RepID=B2JTE0_PARP8|nr:DUF4148 domain-containing protein [Paraburkholderia phymatum]ACC75843.1 conserved hypothetical protein [Paraburkholderia phymatum STM815]
MNRKLQLLVVAFGAAAPLLASAQSNSQGFTRQQVRQEAAEYAAAGFNPARMNPRTWVNDAQAASAKVMTARAEGSSSQVAENKAENTGHCN